MASKIRNEASGSRTKSSKSNSVVADVGRRRSSCGYCKSGPHSSVSHGLWAYSITTDDYQELLDRGWRRSGCFLYKPEMEKTCCPSYTIRLKGSDFVPSKEQLRVRRRMERFLDGALDERKPNEFGDEACTFKGSTSEAKAGFTGFHEEKNNEEKLISYLSKQIDDVVCTCAKTGEFPSNIQLPKASVKKVSQGKRKLTSEGSENLLFTSNISFQIAAALRRAELDENREFSHKSIAEKLTNSLNQLKEVPGLLIQACNGYLNFHSAGTISKDSSAGSRNKEITSKKIPESPTGKKQKLEIRLKKSSFDAEEYELYKKYQINVHNDTPHHVSESSYRNFLVDTPLVFVQPTGDGTVPRCGFGSFHQQYLIDGRLVAVGVVDILPKCLSSKYLFWDPDLAFLSLGKYSALQEIKFVQENQVDCPSLQYYYLGYYIHSCSKMRYKASYRPSELLCPLRYQWIPFDIAKPLLDRKPYVVLSDFATLQNGESSSPHLPDNLIEVQAYNPGQEESNYIFIDGDDQMTDHDFDSSDDESGPATRGLTSDDIKDEDVSNVLIGSNKSFRRFKDLQQGYGASKIDQLRIQLTKYRRAVGADLSERMVYKLMG